MNIISLLWLFSFYIYKIFGCSHWKTDHIILCFRSINGNNKKYAEKRMRDEKNIKNKRMMKNDDSNNIVACDLILSRQKTADGLRDIYLGSCAKIMLSLSWPGRKQKIKRKANIHINRLLSSPMPNTIQRHMAFNFSLKLLAVFICAWFNVFRINVNRNEKAWMKH